MDYKAVLEKQIENLQLSQEEIAKTKNQSSYADVVCRTADTINNLVAHAKTLEK